MSKEVSLLVACSCPEVSGPIEDYLERWGYGPVEQFRWPGCALSFCYTHFGYYPHQQFLWYFQGKESKIGHAIVVAHQACALSENGFWREQFLGSGESLQDYLKIYSLDLGGSLPVPILYLWVDENGQVVD